MVFGQKLEIKRYHTKNLALDSLRGRIGGLEPHCTSIRGPVGPLLSTARSKLIILRSKLIILRSKLIILSSKFEISTKS